MEEKKKDDLLRKLFLTDIKIGEKNWFIYLLLSCVIWGVISSVIYLILGIFIKR